MEIITKTTIDAWKKSLKFILDNGVDFEDKDARLCRELMNFELVIQDPEQDYEKPIDIMQQFEWIYPSKEELSAIILNKEESIGYEYNYGSRIFNYHGLDQINDFIVPLLKKDPSSRRAVISLYDAFSDSEHIFHEYLDYIQRVIAR